MASEIPAPSGPFEGGGDSGALLRSIDWSRTPVGPIPRWPRALRTTVTTLLHSPQPMMLWWGPDLIQFYNDAYKDRVLHEKHPRAMGQPARRCWEGIWPVLGPRIEEGLELGRSSLVPVRHSDGSCWTHGYSPVFEEDEDVETRGGGEARVGGVLLICSDSTPASVQAELSGRAVEHNGKHGGAPASSAMPATSEDGVPAPSGKRILVVDDNVDSAEMLAEVLRGNGHEVAVANDPAAALGLLASFGPEIAILDIGLPVMDGYELAERIHATTPASGCRLIALTGYGQQYDRARSVRTGFANHLVKPVDLDALEHIIDTL